MFDVGTTDAIRIGEWIRPVVASSVFVILALVALAVYLTRPKRGKEQ